MRLSMLELIALGLLDLGGQSALASPRIGAALVRPDSVACVTFRGEPRRTGDHVLLFLLSPPRVVDGWIRGTSPRMTTATICLNRNTSCSRSSGQNSPCSQPRTAATHGNKTGATSGAAHRLHSRLHGLALTLQVLDLAVPVHSTFFSSARYQKR